MERERRRVVELLDQLREPAEREGLAPAESDLERSGSGEAAEEKTETPKRGATRGSRELVLRVCRSLPGSTEDVKWGHDLVFSVGDKMYCATGLDSASGVSFKVEPPVFEALTAREGICPAPYLAKHSWIAIDDLSVLSGDELASLLATAHRVTVEKLPKKKQRELSTL